MKFLYFSRVRDREPSVFPSPKWTGAFDTQAATPPDTAGRDLWSRDSSNAFFCHSCENWKMHKAGPALKQHFLAKREDAFDVNGIGS